MRPSSSLAPIFSALILAIITTCPREASAGEDVVPLERYEREERRVQREYVPAPPPRTVYIVIKERPAPRIVYSAPLVGYRCIESRPRVLVRESCYPSVPSRHIAYRRPMRIGSVRGCY